MRGDKSFPETSAGTNKKKRKSLLNLFRGDFPVFLLFLAIAFFFWWSRAMTDTYEASIMFSVELENVPQEIRVTSAPPSQVSVSFGGKGTALWRVKTGSRKRIIGLDCNQFSMRQGMASYLTMNLRDSLSGTLPSSVTIKRIDPDSISFRYLLQKAVMLPVAYSGTFDSYDQYSLERVIFKPDSVLALIPLDKVDSYDAVYVSIDNLKLATDTLSLKSTLKPVSEIILETSEVEMTVVSQQYTEKSIDVPVTGVNFPDGVTLRTFPSRIPLIFWVKMADFEHVAANDFRVVIDYNDIEGRDIDRAELHLYSQPANVTNVRLQTHDVGFLMEMNRIDSVNWSKSW
ncbi:MAG: hypothetical protein IK006_02165 [Bacteroidaceae bacterium]|nr:hypothetical protein [Bacteroidaceae bacterium]